MSDDGAHARHEEDFPAPLATLSHEAPAEEEDAQEQEEVTGETKHPLRYQFIELSLVGTVG